MASRSVSFFLLLLATFALQRSGLPSLSTGEEVSLQCKKSTHKTNFLVFGGGSSLDNNEIALEKNFLYFQRTLKKLGFSPQAASYYFANGNDGQATVRYLDQNFEERFKVPKIPHLQGSATRQNLQTWVTQNQQSARSVFLYFTGHGTRNELNLDNNYLLLWPDDALSVKEFTRQLDRLSPEATVVTMMSQCYAGSFANFIYDRGDARRNLSSQKRCGFFATLKSLPSVGCTPEVEESDYRDYSSSFFAGLSGVTRTGEKVASADYNRDGRVSFAEAHAYSKVHMATIDLPISTSEAWLQKQTSRLIRHQILGRPIGTILTQGTPQQQYVIKELTKKLTFSLNHSYRYSKEALALRGTSLNPEEQALLVRLEMELVHVGAAQRIRNSTDRRQKTDLVRLQTCEDQFWQRS